MVMAGGEGVTRQEEALDALNSAGEPLVTEELVEGGVVVIRLNRPERSNAWIEEMEIQYGATFDRVAADARVRSIVLTGTGRAFCPGVDRARLDEITGGGSPYMGDRRPMTLLREIPKPIVAAVNGACAGLGMVQAMMADVRFTARDARWSAAFSRIGLVAEDGVAHRIQQVAGDEVAADVLLSGRVFDGEEAVRLGLARMATAPEALLDTAIAYARELALCSPISLALIKRQLVADSTASLESSRQRAVAYLEQAKRLPDFAEGVSALNGKRKPAFAPLDLEAI
jgi:enoyl-CoA hydratase/carnithine racemase